MEFSKTTRTIGLCNFLNMLSYTAYQGTSKLVNFYVYLNFVVTFSMCNGVNVMLWMDKYLVFSFLVSSKTISLTLLLLLLPVILFFVLLSQNTVYFDKFAKWIFNWNISWLANIHSWDYWWFNYGSNTNLFVVRWRCNISVVGNRLGWTDWTNKWMPLCRVWF